MPDESSETCFLNVDLEMRSGSDLTALLAAWGDAVFVLRNSEEDHGWTVRLELCPDPPDLNGCVVGYSWLVGVLPPALRALWDACEDRCLDLGIQASSGPPSTSFELSAEAVGLLEALNARLVVTVYGAGAML